MIRALALMLLAACTAATSVRTSALSTHPACHDPAALGAAPGDGVSDRVAFQSAIDAATAAPDGGTVCIGPGRWTLDRAPVGSYNRFAALSIRGRNVTLAGSGPATVLELAGDQGGGDTTVLSIDPGAAGISIRDLTIDTAAARNTSEQTHAIATSATCSGATCLPISDLEVRSVTFRHPRVGTDRKGDCIRLLGGSEATRVDRVRIIGATFTSCARSAIEIQRNVHSLVIASNTFALSGDQDIDSEPTGGAGQSNSTIVISGNTFAAQPGAQGDYAITLGGASAPMSGVTVIGNVFAGRGIRLYRTATTTIVGNVFTAAMRSGGGVIDVSNVCSGLSIAHNPIARTGTPGPVIRMTPHSGGLCSDVMIDHNQIVQGTAGPGIHMESVSGVTIDHNTMRWTVPAPGHAAIYARATAAPVDHVLIAGNRISGPVTYGVLLSAAPHGFGADVRVFDNAATGPVFGLSCMGSGGFAPMASWGNSLGPRVCAGAKLVSEARE